VACSVQRILCNGPGIRLEGRVLSAEIEYARSRYLVPVEVVMYPSRAEYARRRSFDPGSSKTVRRIQEPNTLDGDLAIPVSQMRFGISESRVRSAEILRSRYLRCGSEYPRAEYARRKSFDPGISDSVFRESSTLDGDRVLSVPRSLTDF